MENNENGFASENQQTVSLNDFIQICKSYWFLFIISVIVCGGLAILYSKSQPLTFNAEAFILIKGEEGTGALPEYSAFSDIQFTKTTSGVQNELFVINSVSMVKQAILRINANTLYYKRGIFRDINIYNESPITFALSTPLSDESKSVVVEIELKDGESYNYRFPNSKTDKEWKKAEYGKEVKDLQCFTVTKSSKYNEESPKELKVVCKSPFSMAKVFWDGLVCGTASKETSVLKFSATGDNQKMVIDILNALIDTYNEDVINDKNRVAVNTENFIRERIAAIANDLSGIDGQIAQLKKTNNIPDFDAVTQQFVQSGERYLDNLTQIETQISLVNYIRDFLSKEENKYELIPENIGIDDIGIQNQIVSFNKAVMELNKLAPGAGKNNPWVIEQKSAMDKMHDNILRSVETFLSSLSIKRSQAKEQTNKMNQRIASVPTQEKEINDVMRQQKIKNELYLYLLNKREENALQLAITEPNAKIIEKAYGSGVPTSPNTAKSTMIGLLFGLLLPAAFIYARLWIFSLNTHIHNRKDIEMNSDIPVLGEIPGDNSKKKKTRADEHPVRIAISKDGKDYASESFRILRSNLKFFLDDKQTNGYVLQMTSTMPGEGKSFFSLNFALSLAFGGKRTLIVDMDLRKGSLSKALNLRSGRHGVSSYLAKSDAKISDYIVKSELSENLDILPSGPLPPNATNLIASKRFEELILTLRKEYNYIILDTVPFSVIADAPLVYRTADLMIYVVRSEKIDRRYLPEIGRMFKRTKIDNACFVVNDVDFDGLYKSNKYGYGYSFGSGYGYGTGYEYENSNS